MDLYGSVTWVTVSLLLLMNTACCSAGSEEKTVILVSFDGFRWDYLFRGYSPALERIANGGVRVKQLKNCFPTKTFPNHYSLVTGLYPESHGIVANYMFDPVLNKHYTTSTPDPAWWNEGEPAWVTLRRRGLVSATLNWPGSDKKIRGMTATYSNAYNKSIPYKRRVDVAISYLQLEAKKRPSFIALYFEEPDLSGHLFGPSNVGTMKAVKRVDGIADYLMQRLRAVGRAGSVDVIFTSDHGMLEMTADREIYLSDYVSSATYELVDYTPLVAILPREGMEAEVFERLRNAHPNMTVYHREDMPERLHYRHNQRIQPIMALADHGWAIYPDREWAAASRNYSRGEHGYDNDDPGVRPYFIATGPSFRRGFKIPLMSSVDVYPLLFRLLGQEALPSNGTMTVAERLLRGQRSPSSPSCGRCRPSVDRLNGAAAAAQLRTIFYLSVGVFGLAAVVAALPLII